MQTLRYTAAAAATIANFHLCLNGLFFQRSLQARAGPKRSSKPEPLGTAGVKLSCHPSAVSKHWTDAKSTCIRL